MKQIAVLSSALLEELGTLEQKPEFRKATPMMRNCGGVAELCLKRLPQGLQDLLKASEYKNVCTILGTSLGEIEVTREFLETLDRDQMARPILFQNSLHNAVAGFLSLFLGLKGPSVTVSQRFMTAENSLETASILMDSLNPFALVVCGEIVVNDFKPGYSKIYPPAIQLTSGSSAVFLATEEAVAQYKLNPIAWIHEITYDFTKSGELICEPCEFYDSNGLEQIIRANFQSLTLAKPDLTRSQISLS